MHHIGIISLPCCVRLFTGTSSALPCSCRNPTLEILFARNCRSFDFICRRFISRFLDFASQKQAANFAFAVVCFCFCTSGLRHASPYAKSANQTSFVQNFAFRTLSVRNSAVLKLLCARMSGLHFLKPAGFKPFRRCSLTGLCPSAIPLS